MSEEKEKGKVFEGVGVEELEEDPQGEVVEVEKSGSERNLDASIPLQTKKARDKQEAFLEAYAVHGTITGAAQAIGATRRIHYNWLNEDPEYPEKFEAARESYKETLKNEIHRRAIHGQDKPVIYKGQIHDWYKEMSDNLLMFHAKAHMPEYKDSYQPIAGQGQPVQVLAQQFNIGNLESQDIDKLREITAKAYKSD